MVGMDAQAPETDRLVATANALQAEQRYAEAAAVYLGIAKVHEQAGRRAEAEAALLQAQAAAPEQAAVWSQAAQFFSREGRFDEAMAASARLTRLNPADPQPFYQLAVFYEEKVRKDPSLRSTQQADYLTAGMEAIDQALALRPEYFEALVYKNLLLRHQARFSADPQTQQMLLEDADRRQRQAIALRDRQAGDRRLP
jgi:tetratricopeptide (TPR) repeat protein